MEVVHDDTNPQTKVFDDDGNEIASYGGVPQTLFVDGDLDSLQGTISKDTRLTIGAAGRVTITGHVRYAETPVDRSELLNDHTDFNPAAVNALGILSETENIVIEPFSSTDIDIHGVLMAPQGVVTVDRYDQVWGRGSVNLLGGIISDRYGAFGLTSGAGYGRNFIYDTRMADIRNIPLGFPPTDGLVVPPRDEEIDDLDLVIWSRSR